MNAKWLGKHIPAKKVISLAVLFAFFAGFVMDAPAVVDVGPGPFGAGEAEGGGYAQVNINTFTIPGHLGEIKYSAKNNPKKIVIHIQDAHCNRYAQRKIADLIAYINAEYGVRTINLEGGVGDYDLAIFTSITGEAIRTEVADYFLKKGELNGAEFFAVNNPDRAFLWGVEDKDLYLANLQVYRDSLRYKEEVDRYLDELSHIMNNLKMHIYTQELITVDMNYNSFKTKKMEFREYFEFLLDQADAHNVDIKKFKNLNLLKDAMEKEEVIDFDRANDERDILIGELKERISRADLRKIVSMTVDFKTKKITQKAFYGHLLDKARRARIDTGTFPMMTSYLDYVSTFEEVDRFKIMGELDELEAAIKEDVFQNDTQRDLNKLSRNSVITKNIFDIRLNKTDYRYYLKNKDSFAVRNYLTFIEKEAPKYRVTARPSRGIARMDDYREELSEFFEFSFMRDEVFLKNMKYERMPYGVEVALLMTGGFHTENLCDLFNKKNISYVSIHPKFTIEKGYESPYFEILAGETTGVQQVLRSVFAQASMMQVASFLSTAMAEAVWTQAGLDSFNGSVMLRALVARGYAVTFSYEDADGTHTLDLNGPKGFNRPADPGAPEITLTSANIIKELHQKQADESVRAAKREEVSEGVRLEVVRLLQNMHGELDAQGHAPAAGEVEKMIDELQRKDSAGNYGVIINLLTEGDVPILFEEHAGGMGLHINRAVVTRADGSIDTGKLLELIVHGISAGFSGDHGVSSLLQQAARAIRARRPVDIDYNDLADVLTSGVMRPGSVWQAREHVIALLASRDMEPGEEDYEKAYNKEMDNILEDRDLFSAVVMGVAPPEAVTVVAGVRAPVERVAPEAVRAEEGPKKIESLTWEDFDKAKSWMDYITFSKDGAFEGRSRYYGRLKLADGTIIVFLGGNRCINLTTKKYTRAIEVKRDDKGNVIWANIEDGGTPIGDFEVAIERDVAVAERPGAEDILREFEGREDADKLEAVLRNSEFARLDARMALASIAEGDLDAAGELIEAAKAAAGEAGKAYDGYFKGKNTDMQERAAEIRDEATGAVSGADRALGRARRIRGLVAEETPLVDGKRLIALLEGKDAALAKPWSEMSNDEIFDMFKDMLDPPSRNRLDQLRRDGRVRLGSRAQKIVDIGYDLAGGKGIHLLLYTVEELEDKERIKNNLNKAKNLARAWKVLKIDADTVSDDFKTIELDRLKSLVLRLVVLGADILGANENIFEGRLSVIERNINRIAEMNEMLPEGFKISFNVESLTADPETLENMQREQFEKAEKDFREEASPQQLMIRLGITDSGERKEILASLLGVTPEKLPTSIRPGKQKSLVGKLVGRIHMAREMGYNVLSGKDAFLLVFGVTERNKLGRRSKKHGRIKDETGAEASPARIRLGILRALFGRGEKMKEATLSRNLENLRRALGERGFTMNRLGEMNSEDLKAYIDRCIASGLDIYGIDMDDDGKVTGNIDLLSDQVIEAVQGFDSPEAVRRHLAFNAQLIRLLNEDVLGRVEGAKTIDIDTRNQVALLLMDRNDIIRQALRNIITIPKIDLGWREFDTFGLRLIESVLGLAIGKAISVGAVIDLVNKGLPEFFARIKLGEELNARLADLSDRFSEALEGKSLTMRVTVADLLNSQDELRNLAMSRELSLIETLRGKARSVEQFMTWLGITDEGLRKGIINTSEGSVDILARRVSDTRKMGYDILNGKGAELLEFGFSGENRLGRRVGKQGRMADEGDAKGRKERVRALGALRVLLGRGKKMKEANLSRNLENLRKALEERGLSMNQLRGMEPEDLKAHIDRCVALGLDIYGADMDDKGNVTGSIELLSDQAMNAVWRFDTGGEVLDHLTHKDLIQLLNNIAPVPFFVIDPTEENFRKTETELVQQAMTGLLVESGSSEGDAGRIVDELYPGLAKKNIQSQVDDFARFAKRAQHINDLNSLIGERGKKIALNTETFQQAEEDLDKAAKKNMLIGQGAWVAVGESIVGNAEVTPQELARRIDLLTKFIGIDLGVPENAEQLKKASGEIRENAQAISRQAEIAVLLADAELRKHPTDARLIAQVFRADVEGWLGKDVGELRRLLTALGVEDQPKSESRLIEMLIDQKYGFKAGETVIAFSGRSGRMHTGRYHGIGVTKGELGVRVNYLEGDWNEMEPFSADRRVRDPKGFTGGLVLDNIATLEELRVTRDTAQRKATRAVRRDGFVGIGNVRAAAASSEGMEVVHALRQRLASDLSEGDWVELTYNDGTTETAKVRDPMTEVVGIMTVWSARGERNVSDNEIIGFRRITRMGLRELRGETPVVVRDRLNLTEMEDEMEDRVRLRIAGQEEPVEGRYAGITDREIIVVVTVTDESGVTTDEEIGYPINQLQAVEKVPARAEDELSPSQVAEARFSDLSFAVRQYAGMENSEMRSELERNGVRTISDNKSELANMLAAVEFGLVPGQIVMVNGVPHYYFGIRIRGDRASLLVRRVTGEASVAPYRSIEVLPTTVDDFLVLDITPNDLISFTVLDENGEPMEDLGNVIYQGITGDTVRVMDASGVREFSVSRVQAGSLEVNRNRWTPPGVMIRDFERMRVDKMPMDMLHEVTESPSLAEIVTSALRFSETTGRNQLAFTMWQNIKTMFPGRWEDYIDAKIDAAAKAAAREEAAAVAAAEPATAQRTILGADNRQVLPREELVRAKRTAKRVNPGRVKAAAKEAVNLEKDLSKFLKTKAGEISRAKDADIISFGVRGRERTSTKAKVVERMTKAEIEDLEAVADRIARTGAIDPDKVEIWEADLGDNIVLAQSYMEGDRLIILVNSQRNSWAYLTDTELIAHLIRHEHLEADERFRLSHGNITHVEMMHNGYNALTSLNASIIADIMDPEELENVAPEHHSDPGGDIFSHVKLEEQKQLTKKFGEGTPRGLAPTSVHVGLPEDEYIKQRSTMNNVTRNATRLIERRVGVMVEGYIFNQDIAVGADDPKAEGLEATLAAADASEMFEAARGEGLEPQKVIVISEEKMDENTARNYYETPGIAGVLRITKDKDQLVDADMFMELGVLLGELKRTGYLEGPLFDLVRDMLNQLTDADVKNPEDLIKVLRGLKVIKIEKIDYKSFDVFRKSRLAVLRSL